ncbi:hypothetical protein PanWU01x14_180970 [Parasponia andersonii]|uniref:Uncharacterized protein n=1 Tax=Parasponia andersonii TaxID=3476 RepID=A0A2P5C669_PARAD|nr:hypothetical protein PanWU01x14_180970 [Parasponia andersonii]
MLQDLNTELTQYIMVDLGYLEPITIPEKNLMSYAQENNVNTNYDIEQGDSDFVNDIELEDDTILNYEKDKFEEDDNDSDDDIDEISSSSEFDSD